MSNTIIKLKVFILVRILAMMLKKVESERPQAEPDFFPVAGLNKYKSIFYFF